MMEPCFLSEQDIKTRLAAISQNQVKSVLKQAFLGLASGKSVQPPQSLMLLPEDAGDCIFYPAALNNDYIGVKVSPYLASLSQAGLYPVKAYTMLISHIYKRINSCQMKPKNSICMSTKFYMKNC